MKSLLKKIFPIIWLKKGFLIYNKVRIATLDRLLYETYSPTTQDVILSESKNPFLELNIDISVLKPKIAEGFSRWVDPGWTQDQYIIRVPHPFKIDPETGWAIAGKNKLIYASLGFSRAPYVKKPSLGSLKKLKVKRLDKIVSFRDTGEENYFHFFNDVLPKLWMLKERNLLDPEAYLIISYNLWNKPYFQHYKNTSELKSLNWYVQKDEWIVANEGLFCKPYTHTVKYWKHAALIVKRSSIREHKNLFLRRHKKSLRFIENEGEVEELLHKMDFLTVDTAEMSFIEQVELFASAKIVVAVHGAGETNIMFRLPDVLKLIEIFHPNEYMPFQYVMLCKLFNYEYRAVAGSVGRESNAGGFRVDVGSLRSELLA